MSRERFGVALADIKSVAWYATVNDLVGGWSISNVDKSASERNFEEGEVEVGDFLTEDLARYIVELQDAQLA